MTLVVGFAPDGRGRGVLHLSAMLARSTGDDLVVCAVIPAPWPPSPARVDAEWRAEVEHLANDALDRARERLPEDIQSWRGFWRNPVTRILLIAVASGIGTAAGFWVGVGWVASLL